MSKGIHKLRPKTRSFKLHNNQIFKKILSLFVKNRMHGPFKASKFVRGSKALPSEKLHPSTRSVRGRNFGHKLLRVLLCIVVVFMVLLLCIYLINLKIYSVSCKNQYGFCSESINNQIQTVVGKNILVSSRDIKNILSNNVLVRDYSIKFLYPSRLSVSIIESKSEYNFCVDDCLEYLSVDKDGKVISKSSIKVTPYVVVHAVKIDVADQVGEKLMKSLRITKNVSMYYQIEKSSLEDDALYIRLTTDREVIFPLNKDEQVLVGSMNFIFGELNTNEEKFIIDSGGTGLIYQLDLRYKNPVIRKK